MSAGFRLLSSVPGGATADMPPMDAATRARLAALGYVNGSVCTLLRLTRPNALADPKDRLDLYRQFTQRFPRHGRKPMRRGDSVSSLIVIAVACNGETKCPTLHDPYGHPTAHRWC